MGSTIEETNFHLPGQVGEVYHGKVGDVYTIDDHHSGLLAVVRTDRISAYDAKLPKPIPYKGQVLNQMSADLLEATADVAPNWLLDVPDPNATVGLKADPVKLEMIMRGNLLGTAWRAYSNDGMRQLCDNQLPDGMREFQAFDVPLLTPTTKAEKDENITRAEAIKLGLATADEYDRMAAMAVNLYARGQEMADKRGLVFPDTKYEFGRLVNGDLVLIDEVHTPDSSRYFPKDEYDAYLAGETNVRPEQMSKEFVREWLKAQGFMNRPGDVMPDMPDDFVDEVSAKYIDLYERMIGVPFEPAGGDDREARIEDNIAASLGNLAVT